MMNEEIKTESDKKIRKDEIIGYSLLVSILPIILMGLFTFKYVMENNIIIYPLVVILIAMGILFLLLFLVTMHSYYIEDRGCHEESIIIDSKIVSVKPVMGKNIWDKDFIEFLNVSLSNGKNYLINIDKHLDLTVSSKLILRLHRNWRYDKLLSDAWEIDNIIKVP